MTWLIFMLLWKRIRSNYPNTIIHVESLARNLHTCLCARARAHVWTEIFSNIVSIVCVIRNLDNSIGFYTRPSRKPLASHSDVKISGVVGSTKNSVPSKRPLRESFRAKIRFRFAILFKLGESNIFTYATRKRGLETWRDCDVTFNVDSSCANEKYILIRLIYW